MTSWITVLDEAAGFTRFAKTESLQPRIDEHAEAVIDICEINIPRPEAGVLPESAREHLSSLFVALQVKDRRMPVFEAARGPTSDVNRAVAASRARARPWSR